MNIRFIDWGQIPYDEALARQLSMVQEVISHPEKEAIVFCSHPPVVTLGKNSQASDVGSWGGPVFPVQRGGRVTYHGPGQVVAYPILHLGQGKRQRDLYLFLRKIETAIILTLEEYGVFAVGGERKAQNEKDKSGTGVWVGERKIASIGLAVKRWVSYHGAAINLYRDPLAFTGISPCGFTSQTMVCLEDLLGKAVPRLEFQEHLRKNFEKSLSLSQYQ